MSCHTLQHTATHCTTLQHIAPHYVGAASNIVPARVDFQGGAFFANLSGLCGLSEGQPLGSKDKAKKDKVCCSVLQRVLQCVAACGRSAGQPLGTKDKANKNKVYCSLL